MTHAQPADVEPAFFAASYWGCLLFLSLLAIVAAGSAVRLLQRGEIVTYDGVLGSVELLQPSPRRASYRVSLQSDEGELVSLRLRNQGRIVAYLQSNPAGQQVQVQARDGIVQSLHLREQAETIVEREAPPLLLAAAVLLPVLLLALFAWPVVQARGVTGRVDPSPADEEE
jgi:hypothetical protein